MPTVFIAVQCYQCSTMQVKQRKKSSNKWTCVVCNEKQSVRKVYSQAFMAKDVRKFVQSFNMSRQFVEQQQELLEEQTLGHDQTEDFNQMSSNNKRTDWSEYVDDDVDEVNGFGVGDDDDEGELCEPNFVTELPKPLFKKPKLRNNYSADCENGEKLQRPVFGKRNAKNNFNNPGKEPRMIVNGRVGDNQHKDDAVDHGSVYGRSNSMTTDITKRNSCDGDHGFTDTVSSSVMLKLKRPVSKWNNFIDDEETRCEEFVNDAAASDEIVEDDVHPDFM